jgi:hypothetical protein
MDTHNNECLNAMPAAQLTNRFQAEGRRLAMLNSTVNGLLQRMALLCLVALPAPAWRAMTGDWSKNPSPVIGDWGFDRPGYPKGLYLHGVTMPEGHLPANPLPNPIIYDNDEYAEILDDDVLCAMAGLGRITLAAQIVTPIDPKGVFKESWQQSAFWHYDRCLRSGMCRKRIPRPRGQSPCIDSSLEGGRERSRPARPNPV